MAATDRAGLLAITETEHAKLLKTLETVTEEEAGAPGPEDDISIKDTIAHRAHWLRLFMGWYQDGKAGLPVATPAPGYKWNQLKPYNTMVRQASRQHDWDTVRRDFDAAHRDFTTLVSSLDDRTLYTPGLYEWMNTWTIGRWAEASGPSSYRSANKFIRKILRAVRA